MTIVDGKPSQTGRLEGEARLRLSPVPVPVPVPELLPLDCQLDRAQSIHCWYRDSGRTVSRLFPKNDGREEDGWSILGSWS